MFNILVLNSSLSGDASVSRLLVADVVAHLTARDLAATVVSRDLSDAKVPHLTPETVAGVRAQGSSPAETQARALSDTLIGELRAADTIVIGAPMYNFSIPSTLKAWFDHVLRAGETFRYSEAGPKGLLGGKHVIVVESRGGFYSDGPSAGNDFQEPYLRTLLGFIGLTDVTFLRAEKIAFGPDVRDQAINGVRAELAKIADRPLSQAA